MTLVISEVNGVPEEGPQIPDFGPGGLVGVKWGLITVQLFLGDCLIVCHLSCNLLL